MLKFIIDTQLPPKLAHKLNFLGAEAIHTTYFPEGHLLDDAEIREIANTVITTKGMVLNIFPINPGTNIKGTNATILVITLNTTGMAIVLVPLTAAFRKGIP